MEEELEKMRTDQHNTEEIMSVEQTSFFSYIYSSWLTKYLWKAYRKGITISDLPSISYLDSSSYNIQKFENLWNEEIRRRGPTSASLLFVAWRFIRFRFLIACTLNACAQLVKFLLQIFLLRELLQYSEQKERSFSCAVYWIIYIITCDLLQMALYTWSDIMNQRTALRLKSACLCLLFKKLMNVNSTGQRNLDELIGMLSNGSHKIYNAVNFGTSIVNAPVVIICATIYISTHMNPLALLGLMGFLLFYLILYWSGHLISYCEKNANEIMKTREEKTAEILDNIKLIKIYGWENHFLQNIINIRKLESKWIWKVTNIKSFMFSMGRAIPIIAFAITFYIEFGCQSATSIAYKVFPLCVVYIVQLYESLEALKTSLHRFKGSLSTFKILKTGLLLEDTSCHAMKPYEASQALAIVNGTFVYDIFKQQKYESPDDEKRDLEKGNMSDPERRMLLTGTLESRRLEVLSNITFKAKKGQLIGICGATGSGKSSLLLAALGQVRMTSGQLLRQGNCAYVGQRAWIINGSVLKNIVFNEPIDRKRYYEAKVVCQVHQAIKSLPDGEMTQIGDRGVNISESFKQRIALARAFHADRDIYCLDDPFSSIEDDTGRRIFDELIVQALAEKTVILVTNKSEYLDRCDYINVMRGGKIVDQGKPRDLRRSKEYVAMLKPSMADAEGDYINEFEELQTDDLLEERGKKEILAEETYKKDKFSDNYNVSDNEVNDYIINVNDPEWKKIRGKTYYTFAKSVGFIILLPALLIYFVHAAIEVYNLIHLTWWIQKIERKDGYGAPSSHYKRWSGINLFLLVLSCIVQSLVSQSAITRITNSMHNTLLEKIINAPAFFFDSASFRAMRGRFLHDLNCVSFSLPSKLDNTLRYIAIIFFTFFVLLSTIPWFTNYVVLTIVFFLYVGKIYRAAQLNFKRLENKMKVEIDSFLQNSLQGLSTIRTFRKENDLLIRFQYLVDHSSVCTFVRGVSKSWLSSRLEVLTASCLFVASFFTISIQQQISPILFGLTFVYIFQVPSIIKMGIKYLLKMEQCFGNVQNICDYLLALRYDQTDNETTADSVTDWSATGCVTFDKVQLRPRHDEPYLLELISFKISKGEKLGILTKTDEYGEKNAFIGAMFRFYDLWGGKITLDWVDISKIDIRVLKKQLALIPEDPIFDGTIRCFLDSEKCHDDAKLWQALEKMHLKSKVSSVVSQLNCSFNKDIFSIAEKQLLFFTRAYLNKIKILLVEENADVEPESAAVIHQVMESVFAESTVLLFARRPSSVLFCNHILVMECGGTAEFDYTSNLLNNHDSNLKRLLAQEEAARKRI